jgi:hypothetical protein
LSLLEQELVGFALMVAESLGRVHSIDISYHLAHLDSIGIVQSPTFLLLFDLVGKVDAG